MLVAFNINLRLPSPSRFTAKSGFTAKILYILGNESEILFMLEQYVERDPVYRYVLVDFPLDKAERAIIKTLGCPLHQTQLADHNDYQDMGGWNGFDISQFKHATKLDQRLYRKWKISKIIN